MSRFNIDGHKMMRHLERVADWQAGGNIFPLYVEISPVGHCNHRCSFCAVDYLGYINRAIDTDVLTTALTDMARVGVKSVMFAGEGEPLLHDDINEIIRHAHCAGLDVALTTNGSKMGDAFRCTAMEYCSWIKVSVNAGDASTYHKVHGCLAMEWGRVWNNIEAAVRHRDKHKFNTTIGVQAVLLPENAHTLASLARKCREVGVDYLVIKPFSQQARSLNTDYNDIVYKQCYDKYLNALNMYANSKFEIITRSASMDSWDERQHTYKRCLSVPHFWAYIMSDGNIYTCSAFLGDERFVVGNIRTNFFGNLWKHRKIECPADISECRVNCRMNKVNQFLWDAVTPIEHENFI